LALALTERKADQAYREIERMIVFQQIRPGSLISEAEMMVQTGLGRTPVREALQQLARNRMVEIHPNKGVLVPVVSVDDQLRQLELRRVLEAFAVRLACTRATPGVRESMQELVDDLRRGGFSLVEYSETIRRTHDLIAVGARNDYLSDAMVPLQGLSRRFWIGHVVDEDREIATGSSMHIAILEAILVRDPEAAQRASEQLNAYLVEFAHACIGAAG
jgi:DNA-binding GntR family transcriptional regulator